MYVMAISNGYPTEKYLTTGIFEFDQARALSNAGYKVVFAVVDVRSIRRWRKWGFEHREKDGLPVYIINLPVGRMPKSLLLTVSSIGLSLLYKKIMKKHGRPSILHAHFWEMGYIAAKLKKRTGVPLVITEHSGLLMDRVISPTVLKRAGGAYKMADQVISVSPALGAALKRNFGLMSLYLPNMVDTSLFFYMPRQPGRNYSFVSVGNLNYQKRMDLTIEAFSQAFSDLPGVTLTIYGDGGERRKLEEQIKINKMEYKIILMGICSREAIAEKLRDSDCFVLASNSETFGVAYIEALACGVPVIATKCGGPEGYVNQANGILIDVDDIGSLTAAMRHMYEHGRAFNREKIVKEISDKFSPEIIATRLAEIFDNIIGEPANL